MTSSRFGTGRVHFHASLEVLFQGRRSPEDIASLAYAAVAMRHLRRSEFETRLSDLATFFRYTRGTSHAAPHVSGIDPAGLESLRAKHGGLLLALFRYGEYRHLLPDLACLGVPYAAEVPPSVEFDEATIFAAAPPGCRAAPSTFRRDASDSRAVADAFRHAFAHGRIGALFLDDAPDESPRGPVEIDFLGRALRVDGRVADLAIALEVPVLPLVSVPTEPLGACEHRIAAAMPLLPDPQLAVAMRRRAIVAACWSVLAKAVDEAPAHWEGVRAIPSLIAAGDQVAPCSLTA